MSVLLIQENQPPRTCQTCEHARFIPNSLSLCNYEPDLVTGNPVRYCVSERLQTASDRGKAVQAALMLDMCGPNGTHWKEEPPKRKSIWHPLWSTKIK